MFELGKDLLESIKDTLLWIPQPVVDGPDIHFACTGCQGACKFTCKNGCKQGCRNGCKGSCKSSCTRSCKGHSR